MRSGKFSSEKAADWYTTLPERFFMCIAILRARSTMKVVAGAQKKTQFVGQLVHRLQLPRMRGHDRSGLGRSRGWCRLSGVGLAQRGLPPVILGRACQGASEDMALVTLDARSDALLSARSAYDTNWGRLSVKGRRGEWTNKG